MYKSLTRVLPGEGQQWGVFAYYLNEDPLANGQDQVRAETVPGKGRNYGHFMFQRAFPTKAAADKFAAGLNNSRRVRAVFSAPACVWIPLDTVLRLDTEASSLTDRSLMRAAAVDKTVLVFKPNLRLTSDLKTRATTPATRATAAAYDLLVAQEELEEYRRAMRDINSRIAQAERDLRQVPAAGFDTWEAEERAALANLVPPAVLAQLAEAVIAARPPAATVTEPFRMPVSLDAMFEGAAAVAEVAPVAKKASEAPEAPDGQKDRPRPATKRPAEDNPFAEDAEGLKRFRSVVEKQKSVPMSTPKVMSEDELQISDVRAPALDDDMVVIQEPVKEEEEEVEDTFVAVTRARSDHF